MVNLDAKTAEVKNSHSLTRYIDGSTITHTQWDDEQPDWYDAGPFEEWLRAKVKKDIEGHLSWYIERLLEKHPVGPNPDVYEILCEDFAKLPNFDFTHYRNNSLKFSLLAAIHRSRSGTALDSDHALFEAFVNELSEGDLFERDAHHFLSLVINLIENPPAVVLEYHQAKLRKQYALDEGDAVSIEYLQYIVNNLKMLSPNERALHHPHLLKLCTTAALCHTMAAGLFDWPEEAEQYLEKGLSFKPDNISLLLIAETFYQTHHNPAVLSDVKARIKAMGVQETSEDDIQGLIDRYTQLCNDYRYFEPETDTKKTVPELLEIEARLNAYWLKLLPDEKNMARANVQQDLIDQKRFLSAGSASVVGWMRNQKRYQEVVDYMMPLCTQLELCSLRHQANTWGFEAFLGNGLSCFLDSQDEAHIPLGIQIIDALETIIPEWHTDNSLYAFGCLAARANQVDRALEYIKALILIDSSSVIHMQYDSDFQNVHEHPVFVALLEKEQRK
jgi:hypothetical protein